MIDNLIESFKQVAPNFLNLYCIINGSSLELGKVGKMVHNEFSYQSLLSVPLKLCKCFPTKELTTSEIGNLFLGAIVKSLNKYHNYENIFSVKPMSEIEKLENKIFCESLHFKIQKTSDLGQTVSRIISEEYSGLLLRLKSIFRDLCFSTTPFSQLMWGELYADERT